MKPFQYPQEMLGDLAATTVGTIIAVAADMALIVDSEGVVVDIAFGRDDISQEEYGDWIGRHWIEIVTTESRPKVEALRREAMSHVASSWRQLNYRSREGRDLPVMYAAVEIKPDGRMVAVGRDLSDVAALQQRLVQAQQALERDYSRLRQAEMRYRLMFQTTSEAVLIVDAATFNITEASPAAERLGAAVGSIVGMTLHDVFDPESAPAIDKLTMAVRTAGHAESVRARLADGTRELKVDASMFRQDHASFFLVRLAPMEGEGALPLAPATTPKLCPYVEVSADGFVVTDSHGHIITANRAFLDMAQLSVEREAVGNSLERWLGRAGVDLRVLLTNLRERGAIRLFATSIHGEHGGVTGAEVSASSLLEGARPFFVFSIRNVNQRLNRPPGPGREIPRSVEELSELIGVVPLKEIVRESTDIIERLCIEAALELTGDNRASAAELLGLSRQSLYVKLRRYGIADDES